MEQELEKLKECDPEVLESKRKETTMAREAANRWTDNVFTIKSWCTRKFGVEEKMIDKNFGIPEDFDYIDWELAAVEKGPHYKTDSMEYLALDYLLNKKMACSVQNLWQECFPPLGCSNLDGDE